MSELLDKQVNVQKESLKKTSGIHASPRKPTKKVCDENDFDELQVIDSSNNEGTNSRVTGKSGGKGWLVVRGRTNGTIKLAMAGT